MQYLCACESDGAGVALDQGSNDSGYSVDALIDGGVRWREADGGLSSDGLSIPIIQPVLWREARLLVGLADVEARCDALWLIFALNTTHYQPQRAASANYRILLSAFMP